MKENLMAHTHTYTYISTIYEWEMGDVLKKTVTNSKVKHIADVCTVCGYGQLVMRMNERT